MDNIKEKHNQARRQLCKRMALLLENSSWNKKLLEQAEQECEFISGYSHVLFPEGIKQVVRYFEEWLNEYALDLANSQTKPEKIRAQIAQILEIRIMQVMSQKAQINHSSYFLVPANILTCQQAAFNAVDMMWRYGGDKSTDFNYYSKRGLLLGVYMVAKAYYFADESKDYMKTKEFIASSLDNIINIASYKNKIKLPNMEDIPILRLFS